MAQSRWKHDANAHACEANSSQRQHALSFIVITHRRCWAPPESAAIGPLMWICMCWPVVLAPSYNFIEEMCSRVTRRQVFLWQQKTCVLAVLYNTCVLVTQEDMYMMRKCTQSCLGPISQFHFSILPSCVMLGVHMKHELTVQFMMQLWQPFLEFHSTFHTTCDYIQRQHPIILVIVSS
jgi:hypothetical protein